MKTICWLCYKVAAPTLKGIIRHMAIIHAHDPEFHIICGIAGCVRTYSNFYSFKRHVYRKHREYLDVTPRHLTVAHHSDDVAGIAITDSNLDFADTLECDDFEENLSDFQHMKNMALFLLKAKEVRKVSQSSLDGLTSDFTIILQGIIEQLKSDINTCLTSNGINMGAFQGLNEVFNHPNIINPFNQLESRYQQEKFYKVHLNLLVSITHYMATIYKKILIFTNFI